MARLRLPPGSTFGPSGPSCAASLAALAFRAPPRRRRLSVRRAITRETCFGDGRRSADDQARRRILDSRARGLGPGPPRHAGRHRRRQRRDRRAGRRQVGLSPSAAAHPADADALHGAGADGPARRLYRPRPRRTHPRALRRRLGVAVDGGPGGGGDRLAHHRIHRRRRHRRALRPAARADPAASRRRPCSRSSPPAPIDGSSGRRSSSASSSSPSSPSPGRRIRASRPWPGDALDLPFGDRDFMFLVAASSARPSIPG